MKKAVSVIIPVHNMELYLDQCISSVELQSYENLEIICVNSCSTDNSATIIKRAMLRDSRIRHIHQETDAGLGGSRNEGLRHATGEYVLFVDSDDWIAHDMIESLVSAIEAQDADYAFGAVEGYDTEASRYLGMEHPFHSLAARKLATDGVIDLAKHPTILTDMYPSAWLGLRRRAKIVELGVDFPENRLAEDHRFHYRYGFNSSRAIYLPIPFYKHRRNRRGQLSSEQSTRTLGVLDTIEENFLIFDQFLPERDARAAKAKTALRLVYEKLGQISEKTPAGEAFFSRARKILSQFDVDEIYLHGDIFVEHRHTQEILGATTDALIAKALRTETFEGRELHGGEHWADVELKFDPPVNLDLANLALSVDLDTPAPISLRLALICDPIQTQGEQAEKGPHVFEFRRTFQPLQNVVTLECGQMIATEGRPDAASVRKICFGGLLPVGKLTQKLFALTSDHAIVDLVAAADKSAEAHPPDAAIPPPSPPRAKRRGISAVVADIRALRKLPAATANLYADLKALDQSLAQRHLQILDLSERTERLLESNSITLTKSLSEKNRGAGEQAKQSLESISNNLAESLSGQILKTGEYAKQVLEASSSNLTRSLSEQILKTGEHAKHILESNSNDLTTSLSNLATIEKWLLNSANRLEEYIESNRQLMPRNDGMHAWHPTWIPSDIPLFFHGNSWIWADKFKEYYFINKDVVPQKMERLTAGLDTESVAVLRWLWETAVFKIPFARTSADAGALLRRDYVYSPADLVEQKKILRHFADNTSDFAMPGGQTMEIPVFYYHHGLRTLERKYLDYMAGYDALDCGAFIGDTAVVLARKYAFRKILSIDPNPDNIRNMMNILSLNGVTNVTPILAGVDECEGELIFRGKSAVTTAVEFDPQTFSTMPPDQNTVRVRSIDDIVESEQVSPRFIKFDIEGFEQRAIRGAMRTIEKHRPILSISVYHRPEDMFEIKPFLEERDLGYRFIAQHQNPFDPIYETVLLALPEL
ncbi:FkbM family methyltransferase [Agrobacterium tumefaciens]|uniref:FkbM family methyltransferase n=1 Tax=Agrobacterium tumefaciens TaxID=358 RepID=UPI0015749038|nr:FkbM family methyltransferase [Agrobacterium tumefaciens]NTE37363.1 FkbM family methyltransferase [Agrobacterium tumefaciens]NTE52872.1 FkbM family methyltransferase [Agrobacterium tumefaciens]